MLLILKRKNLFLYNIFPFFIIDSFKKKKETYEIKNVQDRHYFDCFWKKHKKVLYKTYHVVMHYTTSSMASLIVVIA